ncbi:hypothetical protein [Ekhidna sp.]|uniref:hypothetical protein n=1 Tax=Ekhidna sp. TaxID=2608089 RepID=UPI003B598190
MSEEEIKHAIKDIPVGAKLQLIKSNGDIIEVRLSSHDVSGTEEKDYGELVVPALPPAITVQGGSRFGSFRIEAQEIVKIAWIDE